MGAFHFKFAPSCYVELKRRFEEMLGELLKDSPDENYRFGAQVELGSAASLEGELQNVSPVVRELLPMVGAFNDYPSYNLVYYLLGPRSWRDREKSRKKLREPGHEQLGKLALGSGAVAEVSLGIEKEGYVFYLNFGNDDGLLKFYHSKLFQKTKWHSGAE